MAKFKTKFFGCFDIDDNCLKNERNFLCIKDINAKINLKGNVEDVKISFIDIINYINFGNFDYITYLNYMNKFIKLLDQYPYINSIGEKEIIKSYQQNGHIMERYKSYFSGLEDRINELLIKNSNDICLKNVEEGLDIKKIVKMADLPNIGLGLDENGNLLVILQYNLVFIGIVSIKLDEHFKLYNMGYEYFRQDNEKNGI